jgi:hypothetical protein
MFIWPQNGSGTIWICSLSRTYCVTLCIVRETDAEGKASKQHIKMFFISLQMLRGQDGEIQEWGDWNATSLGAIPSSDGPRLWRQRVHSRTSFGMLLLRKARHSYFAQESGRKATGIRRRQLRHSRACFLMRTSLVFFARQRPKLILTTNRGTCVSLHVISMGGDYALHCKFVSVNHILIHIHLLQKWFDNFVMVRFCMFTLVHCLVDCSQTLQWFYMTTAETMTIGWSNTGL